MAENKSEDVSSGEASYGNGGPAITDENRMTAHRAVANFEAGEYDKCLSSLAALAQSRPKDPKLIHNRSVAEFYRSGTKKIDLLRRSLTELYAKLYPDGHVEGLDSCCIPYNCSVILYHTRQYRAALNILEKLLAFIEPTDDAVHQKIILLAAELYICTNQPQKALEMISLVEKCYASGDKTSSDRDDSGEGTAKGGSLDSERTARGSSLEPQIDSNKSVLCQLKIRCYLMLKSIKYTKGELKTLINCSEPSPSIIFTKARYEAVRFNFSKCLRILNSSPQLLGLPPSDPLSSVTADPNVGGNQCVSTMYYNNVAIAHFYQRKHSLGLFYLRRALEENSNFMRTGKKPDDALPLSRQRSNRYYELMYNLGVETLHTGQPQAAFDHLLEVVQVYHTNPRLWLRLAECCIMCHRQSNDDDRRLKKKMEVIHCSVGSGLHRKLVLGSGVTVDNVSSGNEAAIPVATMEFASLCLDNALLLISDVPSQSAKESDTGAASSKDAGSPTLNGTVLVPAPPGNPMRLEEVENLRCSVLATRSYVALYHNDHLVALQCAEQLLRQPRLSGAHRFLAHQYSAEALVALDRISDGIDHLNSESLADVSTNFPSPNGAVGAASTDKMDTSDVYEPRGTQLYPWSPNDVRSAKVVSMYNLATAYAIRGEHDKALHQLAMSTQLARQPLPAQMYFLKIYLELTEGRKKVAQHFIREQFHTTLNRQ